MILQQYGGGREDADVKLDKLKPTSGGSNDNGLDFG